MALKDALAAKALKMKEIAGKAARYLDASEKMRPLDAEKRKLSGELKEAAESYGTKDDKGSFSLETGGFVIKKIMSKSTAVNAQKAVDTLRRLGLLERCTTRVVDEKQLEVCFQEGLLTLEDINSFSEEVEGTPKVSVSRA
jgi:hypothetical protein